MAHPDRPARDRRLVKSLYFSLDNAEDVRLLGLILTLPPSQQNRILKAALREALPKYLQRHYPEVTRLRLHPQAIAEAIERARQPQRRPRQAAQPAPQAVPPPPSPRAGQDPVAAPPSLPQDPAPSPPVPSPPSEAERLQETERKLDRLFRAWTVSGTLETASAEE